LISTAPSSLFEGCCGAIDGWVVTINKPKDGEVENVADYHSGHYCCYGLVVLAMCDSQLCFTYSAIAGTGRTNDARAFGRLEALQQWLSDLPAPYFIVGDNAFPLTNKMLVPFPGRLRQQAYYESYNFYQSQLRIRIEMAFGRMTTKWRIFRKPLDTALARSRDIIMACMRLHNYVIRNDGVRLDNRRSSNDLLGQFRVEPLPQQHGLDAQNNGYLPEVELEYPIGAPNAHRRNGIFNRIKELELVRPFDNIERNG
jgi:hypothetical protein